MKQSSRAAVDCSCLKGPLRQETVREFLATWRLGNAKRACGSTCCLGAGPDKTLNSISQLCKEK